MFSEARIKELLVLAQNNDNTEPVDLSSGIGGTFRKHHLVWCKMMVDR